MPLIRTIKAEKKIAEYIERAKASVGGAIRGVVTHVSGRFPQGSGSTDASQSASSVAASESPSSVAASKSPSASVGALPV
jgi:hypothetical protein